MSQDARGEGTTVSVTVTVGRVAGLLVLLVTASYFLLPSVRTTIVFFSAAVVAAATVVSAVYLGSSVRRQTIAAEKSANQQKLDAAFRLMMFWNSPGLLPARAAWGECLDLFAGNDGHAAILKKLQSSDNPTKAQLRLVLNFFETVALAVRLGYADEAVLRDGLAGIMKRSHIAAKAWIDDHRKVLNRTQIWKELEWLCLKWAEN